MIIAKGQDRLVQIPKDGDADGVFKPAIIHHVAQLDLVHWILGKRKPIVQVDPEIADENVERELRAGLDKDSVRVRLGMIDVKGITDAEVETQRIELGYRPNRVNVELGSDDDIRFLVYLGEVDV